MSMHKRAAECSEGDYRLWFRTIEFLKHFGFRFFFLFLHIFDFLE